MPSDIRDALELAERLADEETAVWASKRARCTNDGDEESADMYEKKRAKSSSLTMKIRAILGTI